MQGEIVRLMPPDLHAETIEFSLPDTLIGNFNVALQPFDTIRLFGRYEQDAPNVIVRGEVMRPGSYALSEGMTAAQLVRMAGGFKRDALLTKAGFDQLPGDEWRQGCGERRDLPIGDAVLKADNDADAPLKPGDVLTVHQITGWNDIGASIDDQGRSWPPRKLRIPARGAPQRRAASRRRIPRNGVSRGAVLTRPEVRSLEEKSREELIRQIETSSAAARLLPMLAAAINHPSCN